jgi:leucyl aminopeptidase
MNLQISTTPFFEASENTLHVQVVTLPFDRESADLDAPADVATRLTLEAKRRQFKGELGQVVMAQGGSDGQASWYALVGAGASPRATDYRRVASAAVRAAGQVSVTEVAIGGAVQGDRARYLAEGLALTTYRFDQYFTAETESGTELTRAVLLGDSLSDALHLGVQTAEAICFARDLANEHPGKCNPEFLAKTAEEMATRFGFECKIRREQELEDEGFNLIMAVGKGSVAQPRLIHLTYRGAGENLKKIALVGKGVTYDSGGYSLKPPASQVNMHLDMGGSAAVLGAAEAVGRLQPAGVEVHFIVPTAENMVSGAAVKLNEIVTSYSGKTVEILNTDAEGRLILADALWYASRLEPDVMIDLATLTGACVVALGEDTAGVFSPDDALVASFLEAAVAADESMWRMPLSERSQGALKSDFADMKNIGSRWGGAITAAHFLRRFTDDMPWIHVDIAGPGMTESAWEYINKGGTGFGVATLSELIHRMGQPG